MDKLEHDLNHLEVRFHKARRTQVLIAFIIVFPSWFFFGGRDLRTSFVIALIAAIARWIFFTRNIR